MLREQIKGPARQYLVYGTLRRYIFTLHRQLCYMIWHDHADTNYSKVEEAIRVKRLLGKRKVIYQASTRSVASYTINAEQS